MPEKNIIERTTDWPWPESLDARVAAPDHHTLLLENERVRVLVTLIPPGDSTPVHTHRWPSLYYFFSWSARSGANL